MIRRAALVGLLVALAATQALAAGVERVQAEGVAPLPPVTPGGPPAPAPDLRALRRRAVADGIDKAVLEYARRLTRQSSRGDDAALRAALGGKLADLTLGHGVVADLGAREAVPPPGEPAPRPRRPKDPIPMEHAWRIEALVDGDRVLAALRSAGLALAAGDAAAAGTSTRLSVAAPYDAPALAALRAKLVAVGATAVVPRRYAAGEAVFDVRGLAADVLQRRLASEPPAGYALAAELAAENPTLLRVRLVPAAAGKSSSPPGGAASKRPSD